MEIVQGEKFEGRAVQLDGKYFFRCLFIGCTIVYEGGECQQVECTFERCSFGFTGAAGRTVGMLIAMGWREPEGGVQSITPASKTVVM